MWSGGGTFVRRDPVWVTLLFLLLTLILAYPLSLHPGSTALPLAGDTRLFIWTLGWDVHALTSRPWALFEANIFAPEHLTLAYSENCFGSALIAAPFLWATRNPVLAMNAVVLMSCVLCGAGTYMLARQLGLSRAGSVLAGIIFAFAPPRFLRLGQLHLTTVQWLPLCLVYVHRYLEDGRPRNVKIAAALFTVQALTSGHGGLFLTVALICLAGWRLARREALHLRSLARDLGLTGAACLALVLLFLLPYQIVQREQGLVRNLDEARAWSPNVASYLASPSPVHRYVLSFLPVPPGEPRAVLFPGVLPLLLGATGVWALARNADRRWSIGLYVVVFLVGVWLSLGPDYGLYLLAYRLPGGTFIRVPSRYVTLALLALGLVAAHGFDALTRRVSWRNIAGVAAGLLLALEFNVSPLNAVPYDAHAPAADRWLNGRAKPFTVAEVPVLPPSDAGRAESRQSVYMVHSMAHWQKTVNGFSGHQPWSHTQLYAELARFPDEASLAALQRFGVDYVVVHATYYQEVVWRQVHERLARHSARLKLVFNDGDARVYAMPRAGG